MKNPLHSLNSPAKRENASALPLFYSNDPAGVGTYIRPSTETKNNAYWQKQNFMGSPGVGQTDPDTESKRVALLEKLQGVSAGNEGKE